MEQLNNSTIYLFVGGLVLFIAGMVCKQWFTKFVNKKFDDIYIRQELNEKERERDNYVTMRGQQVTCDCLHQLSICVLKGDHLEDLEAANKELEEFRTLLNKTITEKASRWNIHIQ